MKKIIFSILVVFFFSSAYSHNPFEKYGLNIPVATFSQGEFEEFHDLVEIVEIGSIKYNVKRREIVGFLSKEKSEKEVSVVTTAMSIDPHCERYYWISPYAFCLNNPVRYVDPDGRDVWEIDHAGNIIRRIEDTTQDAFFMVDNKGNRTYTVDESGNKIYNSISFEYGTVESQRTIGINSTESYDIYQVRGDDKGTALFEFLGNNVTGSSTMVEVSQAMTGIAGDKGLNFITTAHQGKSEPGITHLLNGQLLHGYTIRELNHTHPIGRTPSGNVAPNPRGDLGFKEAVNNYLTSKGMKNPSYNIYHVPSKTKIKF